MRLWRLGNYKVTFGGVLYKLLLRLLISGLQDLERAHEGLIDAHHGTSIVEFSAIVWCREESDELPLGKEFITILHNLMGSADEIQVVFSQETGHDVTSKGETDSSIVVTPSLNVLVGIRPQKIAQQSGVGNVSGTNDSADLFHESEVW